MRSITVPEQGQLVQVRERRWVVADVDTGELPQDAQRLTNGHQHLVTLRSVEEDAEPSETLQVVWELEPGARAFERAGLPEPESLDDGDRFDAFLNAVRWGASSSADSRRLLAPFQSGVEIEAYQLDPLARAIRMPRVSLLIADDVGLGKTIEAGLVAQELVLRYRARRILVVAPADLLVQWRDEMRDKFGLDFRIVDSELVKRLRRERGVHANPWTHFPRLITSMDYLKRERPLRRFRETLPGPDEPRYPRRFDLLIVDEAHNVAPSGRGRYATDSLRTAALREVVPHFEHRLFLTATPHNGYDESFTALLELLDDQRFARAVRPSRSSLRQVMVRRLKSELPLRFDGSPHFPERKLIPIEVDYSEEERQAHADLRRYTALRVAGARDRTAQFAAEFVLKLLKKRLLSSPAAFARTLAKHRQSLEPRTSGSRFEIPAQLSVLRRRVDEVDEGFETDDDHQAAEDDAQDAAARALPELSDEERNLLDRLGTFAERASARPDAKAEQLIELVERTCRRDGRWSDERIIVFTEYRDTQRALLDLLAARGLTEGDRTLLLYGGMHADERARIKAAFRADPAESPVRVLLATDSASEGINLQNHCHRLVHFEIPWNPNRLEQRNGRVDRHGQRAPEVLIHHFAPRGYELARASHVPVGELHGDVEFLCRAVEKVQNIREMLGKVGPVIAGQVEEAMLGRRHRLDTEPAEREGEAVRRQLAFERRLEAELRELQDSYDETRAEQRLTPEHIEAAVRVALELAGQPPLVSDGAGRFRLPPLTDAWARCIEGLAHPYTGEDRPVVFDPRLLSDDDVVLAHLGHRLVQMSLRLLRAEVWQPAERRRLERVTARLVDDPRMRDPIAVVYARIVVTGGDGHRLHEEVIQAGGLVREGRLERLGVGALREALERPAAGSVSEAMRQRLLHFHSELIRPLLSALDARARERLAGVAGLVDRRRNEEVEKITAVLAELRERILAELEAPPERQLRLESFDDDERDQLERNREFLRVRAEAIPQEIEREAKALRQRFRAPQPRVFPVAVEYRVPRALEYA